MSGLVPFDPQQIILIAMKMTTGRPKDAPKLAELLELRRIVQAERPDETGATPSGEATEDADAT